VPKEWRWPEHLPVKAIWDLWFFGDMSTKIRPYSLICRTNDLGKVDRNHGHLRCKTVIACLQGIIDTTPAIVDVFPPGVTSVGRLSLKSSDDVFEAAFSILIQRLYTDRNQEYLHRDAITPGRLYNVMCVAKKERASAPVAAHAPTADTLNTQRQQRTNSSKRQRTNTDEIAELLSRESSHHDM